MWMPGLVPENLDLKFLFDVLRESGILKFQKSGFHLKSLNSTPCMEKVLQGIPTDQDLQNYPCVHLTSPHEWDPSVLDYEHPENNEEPNWAIDPNENFQFDPNFDEFGDYVNRSLSILDILDETHKTSPIHNLLVTKHVFQCTPVDYEKLRPFFGWVNSDIVKQTIDQTTQW